MDVVKSTTCRCTMSANKAEAQCYCSSLAQTHHTHHNSVYRIQINEGARKIVIFCQPSYSLLCQEFIIGSESITLQYLL